MRMQEIRGADCCAFVDFNQSNDFYLYEVGTYKCEPSYSYGPIVRPESIFHYVVSGKGTLIINGQKHRIHAHQGFLIPINCMAYYEADKNDPWHYAWIHVDGPRAKALFDEAGLSEANPIFVAKENADELYQYIVDIYEHVNEECYCLGKVYEFFNTLLLKSKNKKVSLDGTDLRLQYVQKLTRYIQVKYSEDITIEDMAYICGLNRSYMTRLFKEATGYTPQQYLINYRMKMARKYLKDPTLSVQHVAYFVGYSDSFTFSKAFKKQVGVSPSQYREEKLLKK